MSMSEKEVNQLAILALAEFGDAWHNDNVTYTWLHANWNQTRGKPRPKTWKTQIKQLGDDVWKALTALSPPPGPILVESDRSRMVGSRGGQKRSLGADMQPPQIPAKKQRSINWQGEFNDLFFDTVARALRRIEDGRGYRTEDLAAVVVSTEVNELHVHRAIIPHHCCPHHSGRGTEAEACYFAYDVWDVSHEALMQTLDQLFVWDEPVVCVYVEVSVMSTHDDNLVVLETGKMQALY